MSRKLIVAVGLFAGLGGTGHAARSADLERIRASIDRTPKLSVENPSADPDGDVIAPPHGEGYAGHGAERVQLIREKRHLTRTLESYVAFDPNADALYPCALVQGRSLPDGVLSPIAVPRTPATITVTDLAGTGTSARYSRTVANPTLESVTGAIGEVVQQDLADNQPAKIAYSATAVSSVAEGFLKLGASVKWLTGHVSGSFQERSSTHRTAFLVRFAQAYYTVSCAAPTSPVSFFAPDARYRDFQAYAGDGNPPAYIASVTYGRELWMLVESDESAEEVQGALRAAFDAGVAGGKLALDAKHKALLNRSHIQILVLGGAGLPAVELASGDPAAKLHDYLVAGASFSKASPGVVISYTARYLKDNEVARVSAAEDYVIQTSQPAPEPVALTGVRVTWDTTGGVKHWRTEPLVEVRDRAGRTVATLQCCGADRDGGNWVRGRRETRSAKVVPGVTNEDLANGSFSAKRRAKGLDWAYEVTVELSFADGTTMKRSCKARNACGATW